MNMHWKRLLTSVACAGGMVAGPAMADEHVLILLDRTGSMTEQSVPGLTRLDVAKARIQGYMQVVPATTTKYALWTFEGTTYTPIFNFADNPSQQQISTAVAGVTAGGITPLASSICAAIDSLLGYLPTQLHTKRVYLVTDGAENASLSTDQCYGPWSVGTWPNLDSGSWQWKVRNKACTGDASSAGACGFFPPPYPPGLTMIADIDYLFTENIPLRDEHSDVEGAGKSLTASPMGASATAAAEVAFFQGLAQQTKGAYASVTQNTPPSQASPLPGDANRDGCVNVTDRSVVLSKFGQKVPAGDPADFNRNLSIDDKDYQTVLNNYGRGCTAARTE